MTQEDIKHMADAIAACSSLADLWDESPKIYVKDLNTVLNKP